MPSGEIRPKVAAREDNVETKSLPKRYSILIYPIPSYSLNSTSTYSSALSKSVNKVYSR
jgi:hypothetical protein